MTITRKFMFAAAIALSMLGVGSAFAQRSDNNLTPLQTTGTYSESFETLAAWGGYTNVAITNGWYSDFPGGSDQSAITNMPYTPPACGYSLPGAAHTNVLQLNTQGATLTNSFGSGFNMANAVTYMDTMVQFVPQGDLNPPSACTATDNGIKLAVYVNGNTNLVIYHGVNSGSGAWSYNTNDVISAITLSTSAWYRLSVAFDATCFNDGGITVVDMFQVLTNGVAVQSSNAYDGTWKAAWSNDTLVYPSSTGTWFRSATAPDSQTFKNKHLNSIAFQGTGFIDDLVVTTNTPTVFNTGGPTYFAVVCNISGGMGNFSGPTNVSAGGYVTNTFTASNNWFVSSFTGNGGVSAGGIGFPNTFVTITNGPVAAPVSETVSFTRPTNTLTIIAHAGGTASPAGPSVDVLYGDSPSVLFTALGFNLVASATPGGTAGGTNATVSFNNMTNAATAEAYFYRPTNTVALSCTGGSAGGSQIQVLRGEYATNNFVATQWYLYSSYSGGTLIGSPTVGVDTNVTLVSAQVFDNSQTMSAIFTRPSRNVALNVTNGTVITSNTSVPNGAYVTNDFTGTKWYLANLISGGSYTMTTNNNSVTVEVVSGPVTGDTAQTVTFSTLMHNILQIIGVGGSVNTNAGPATNTYTVANGDSIVLTNMASQWYQIDTLLTNGVAAADAPGQTNYVYMLSEVQSDFSNNVTFVRPIRTITLNPLDHVTGVATTNVLNGDYATNVFAADQYWFVGTVSDPTLITAGGTGEGQSNVTLTAGPVTNDFSEIVTFYRTNRTISIYPALVNGTALPAGPISVLNGNSTSILFTAADWYKVSGLSPSGVYNGKTGTVTFTTLQADANASATFTYNDTGAVVANVPSSWALGLGVSEAWATANAGLLQESYMLGLNTTNVNPSLTIAGIGVSGSSVNVTVLLDNNSVPTNTTIYGTLQLLATSNLTNAFTQVGSTVLTGAAFTNSGKHVVSFTDAKSNDFYKAKITLP